MDAKDTRNSTFLEAPAKDEISAIPAVVSRRSIDPGHSIKYHNVYYQPCVQYPNGLRPRYFQQGTKALVVKAFDGSLLASINEELYIQGKWRSEAPTARSSTPNWPRSARDKSSTSLSRTIPGGRGSSPRKSSRPTSQSRGRAVSNGKATAETREPPIPAGRPRLLQRGARVCFIRQPSDLGETSRQGMPDQSLAVLGGGKNHLRVTGIKGFELMKSKLKRDSVSFLHF